MRKLYSFLMAALIVITVVVNVYGQQNVDSSRYVESQREFARLMARLYTGDNHAIIASQYFPGGDSINVSLFGIDPSKWNYQLMEQIGKLQSGESVLVDREELGKLKKAVPKPKSPKSAKPPKPAKSTFAVTADISPMNYNLYSRGRIQFNNFMLIHGSAKLASGYHTGLGICDGEGRGILHHLNVGYDKRLMVDGTVECRNSQNWRGGLVLGYESYGAYAKAYSNTYIDFNEIGAAMGCRWSDDVFAFDLDFRVSTMYDGNFDSKGITSKFSWIPTLDKKSGFGVGVEVGFSYWWPAGLESGSKFQVQYWDFHENLVEVRIVFMKLKHFRTAFGYRAWVDGDSQGLVEVSVY